MTKKLITLIMAVLLPLSAFQMSADEKEARKIHLNQGIDSMFERQQEQIPVQVVYFVTMETIQTSVISDLGSIEMIVTNLTTGETWSDTFDSDVSPHFLQISGAPGFYEITYLTSFGDLYEGTFTIE